MLTRRPPASARDVIGAYLRRQNQRVLDLTPEQRRARYTAEFDERTAGVEPYPQREKDPFEREMDRLITTGQHDLARELGRDQLVLMFFAA